MEQCEQPMVELLLDAPAALIESVPGQAHDVEGIHDRPRAGEFFGGRALETGESIHRDNLNTLAPDARLGGQPGLEDLFGAARDHVQEPGGTTAIADGSQVQDDGDVFVAVGSMTPHVFIHPDDTHAFEPGWIVDERALAFAQDSGISGIPGHSQGLGDARHRSSPVIRQANTVWLFSTRWPDTSNPRPSRRVNALRSGRSKVV